MNITEDGKLLRTMGMSGTTGDASTTDRFNGVSDVLVAPDGSIFVADGHSDKTNDRILKYDRNGNFLLSGASWVQGRANSMRRMAWRWTGKAGFMSPTVPTAASRSSTSRANSWANGGQFGRPSGIFITKDDMIYVADSLSSEKNNPGFKNGIRWGHISDGKVLGFIPWGEYNAIEGWRWITTATSLPASPMSRTSGSS